MEATQSPSWSPHLTTIAKKVIMALTGLVWIGFVFFHMYGNLKMFMGAAYFNHYAEALRELGAPVFGHLHLLTLLRIVVVVALILHVWAAISLTRQAQKARSTKYEVKRTVAANYASITMRYGGTVILLFILFHLADLTWGVQALSPDFDRQHALFECHFKLPEPAGCARLSDRSGCAWLPPLPRQLESGSDAGYSQSEV